MSLQDQESSVGVFFVSSGRYVGSVGFPSTREVINLMGIGRACCFCISIVNNNLIQNISDIAIYSNRKADYNWFSAPKISTGALFNGHCKIVPGKFQKGKGILKLPQLWYGFEHLV